MTSIISRFLLISSLGAALCLPLNAQLSESLTGLDASDAVVDAIYAIDDADLQVMNVLDELSNGIGARLTSSKNLTEACH